jgi:hypothetical protein
MDPEAGSRLAQALERVPAKAPKKSIESAVRSSSTAMLLYSLSMLFIHLMLATTCFSLRPAPPDAGHAKAGAYSAGVVAVISAAVRFFQVIVYCVGDGTWITNMRLGNGALSVAASSVLVGLTAPKISALYEARGADATPTAGTVFYSALVGLILGYIETVMSHASYVVDEKPREFITTGRAASLRMLFVSALSVSATGSLGLNAYAVVLCSRLKTQTVLAYHQYTADATLGLAAVGTLQSVLLAALVLHGTAFFLTMARSCSRALDIESTFRMLRICISMGAFVLVCLLFGAVLPGSVMWFASKSLPYTFASGVNLFKGLSDFIIATFAMFLGEMLFAHALAASRSAA